MVTFNKNSYTIEMPAHGVRDYYTLIRTLISVIAFQDPDLPLNPMESKSIGDFLYHALPSLESVEPVIDSLEGLIMAVDKEQPLSEELIKLMEGRIDEIRESKKLPKRNEKKNQTA